MNKYNIILHTTTFCNYDCSYCDIIKDKQHLSSWNILDILNFIKNNYEFINRFKFFWWEPLLAFEDIKYIINNSKDLLWNKFEIVTNTTLLNDEIWEYFNKYFEIIFFSIDTENKFDFEKVFNFIDKYNLASKIYFNLIISPWKEEEAYQQYLKIYNNGYKNFNILPVYFTKEWTNNNLSELSKIMKFILDTSLIDKDIKLYWFQSNTWYNKSLVNDSLFIDLDSRLYYSDFVSTYMWKQIKKELLLWDINELFLNKNINLINKQLILKLYEANLSSKIKWQNNLHKLMDYFSKYLNTKKWIIKD